jgi:heptosyltransferase-1/heptosyltransferase-2
MSENSALHKSPRILIFKPSAMGDVILTLPALRQLRLQYPDAYIAWVVNKPFIPFLEENPWLDEIIPFDRKAFGKMKNWGKLLGFMKELRQKKFEIVFDFQGLLRSGLISYFSGASHRVGMTHAREGSTFFYNWKIQIPKDKTHVSDQYTYVVSAFHKLYAGETCCPVPMPDEPVAFKITPETREKVSLKLKEAGWQGEPLVLIHPGARWETKRWYPEAYAKLAEALIEKYGVFLLLIGGKEDIPLSEAIHNHANKVTLKDWTGKTSIQETMALMEKANLVIAHDSGPMHLAGALNIPVAAIFGPSDPHYSGPRHPHDTVIQAPDIPCAPCFKVHCPGLGHICMKNLTPEKVLQSLEKYF